MDRIDKIKEKIYTGNLPITDEEALELFEYGNLLEIAHLADTVRWQIHPEKTASFVIDRNINYTDGCVTGCKFCGFHKKPEESLTLDFDTLLKKVDETVKLEGTGILLQGGMNPLLPYSFYIDMLKTIKNAFPQIDIHGFSPPEIQYFSKHFNKPVKQILEEFIEAGLGSIPGGGAEILVDKVRERISPKKCSADEWIEVMRQAHKLGLKTTATMMFGTGESFNDRIEHFRRIRELQEETGGFVAFIPWTYQIYKGRLIKFENTAYDYLKTLSIARIYLHNIPNIQASWVTQGKKIGQTGLKFGANDLGSTMIEENVVKSVGVSHTISKEEIIRLIHDAGFDAVQRRNTYGFVKKYPKERKAV